MRAPRDLYRGHCAEMLECQLPVGAGPSYIQLCNQIRLRDLLDTSKDRGSVTSLQVSSAPDHLFATCAIYFSNLSLDRTAGTPNPEGAEVFYLPSLSLLCGTRVSHHAVPTLSC